MGNEKIDKIIAMIKDYGKASEIITLLKSSGDEDINSLETKREALLDRIATELEDIVPLIRDESQSPSDMEYMEYMRGKEQP